MPGRFLTLGPVEVETRRYSGRHAFFDPIGTVSYVGCTCRPEAEIDAMEERDEPGWWEAENWLAPGSRPPVYGGNVELNLRGCRLSVSLWRPWAYRLCKRLNAVLLERAERALWPISRQ